MALTRTVRANSNSVVYPTPHTPTPTHTPHTQVEGDTVTFTFEMKSGREHSTPDRAMWGFSCTVRPQESTEDSPTGRLSLARMQAQLSSDCCNLARMQAQLSSDCCSKTVAQNSNNVVSFPDHTGMRLSLISMVLNLFD